MRTSPSPRLRLALLAGLLASMPAWAGTLEGTILGKSGPPKSYVRVELSGPESRTLITGADGSFSAKELPSGSYVLNITELNRRQRFHLQVTEHGGSPHRLRLDW